MVDARRFAPGERLEVRGGNIGTDLVVRVELVSSETVIPLGEAVCDGHGDFTQTFVLPKDLPSGTYTLQAIDLSVPSADVVLASIPVSIGTAGWGFFGISAIVMAPILAVLAVALVVGRSIRRRGQRGDRAVMQPDVNS